MQLNRVTRGLYAIYPKQDYSLTPVFKQLSQGGHNPMQVSDELRHLHRTRLQLLWDAVQMLLAQEFNTLWRTLAVFRLCYFLLVHKFRDYGSRITRLEV